MTKELFSSLQQTPAIGKATLFDSLQANKASLWWYFLTAVFFSQLDQRTGRFLEKKKHTTSSSHDRREQQLSLSNAEWYVTNKWASPCLYVELRGAEWRTELRVQGF